MGMHGSRMVAGIRVDDSNDDNKTAMTRTWLFFHPCQLLYRVFAHTTQRQWQHYLSSRIHHRCFPAPLSAPHRCTQRHTQTAALEITSTTHARPCTAPHPSHRHQGPRRRLRPASASPSVVNPTIVIIPKIVYLVKAQRSNIMEGGPLEPCAAWNGERHQIGEIRRFFGVFFGVCSNK